MDLEWETWTVLQTQKQLALIDHQHGIKSKNTGIENQGEGVGIQV